jgi:DNA-directed RNA polymerase specialized sigma24 family protein
MRESTTRELTEDELQQEREAAAARAVEKALDDVPENVRALAAARMGLVTAEHIAEIYGVTEQTARNWAGEPVNPSSRPYLYDVEDLPDDLAA